VVLAATIVVSYRLPNLYTSETVIMVDPQKVPDAYVKSTVTGDVRNRLGTLAQQILSASRLQKVIETLNLYPGERKKLAREDVIKMMRKDISGPKLVSEFGGSQDLLAFRLGFVGKDARLVAQVANELASLFIEENLKAREQQATGTTEFLENQLQETRKTLEEQEAKLRDFRLKHIGEMPEQQDANLQILGQLQSQLQLEGEALSRAEQQKSYIQTTMAQGGAAPVVDFDNNTSQVPSAKTGEVSTAKVSAAANSKAKLAALLARGYTDKHPEVRKAKKELADAEAADAAAKGPEVKELAANTSSEPALPAVPATKKAPPSPVSYNNPVLQAQLNGINAEIEKHQQEQQRLKKIVGEYQTKLEAIPVREQQITELVRDYEISKGHYSRLLENQLSAETATQLEIRQKGEKFTILDPAQPAERPSWPNRLLINTGGGIGGLVLGLVLALVTESLGTSITSSEQIVEATGIPVLEVIPVIQTRADRRVRKRRLAWAAASSLVMSLLAVCAFLLYNFRV